MSIGALPWFLLSYLVGAIPTSLIVGKLFRKIDLREHGSRNLGATNVYRVLGWKYAIPVAILDIAVRLVPRMEAGEEVLLVVYIPGEARNSI